MPKDTKMFLQSSGQRKSKILTAAMEVDEDYKRLRAKLENVEVRNGSIEYETGCTKR